MGESGSLLAIVAVRPLEGVVARVAIVEVDGAVEVDEGLEVFGAEAIVFDAASVDAVSSDVGEVSLAVLVLRLADVPAAVLIKSLRTQPDAPESNSTLYHV